MESCLRTWKNFLNSWKIEVGKREVIEFPEKEEMPDMRESMEAAKKLYREKFGREARSFTQIAMELFEHK